MQLSAARHPLVLLYPLLGLLWSRAQQRLAARFSIVPRRITGLSILTVSALLLGQAAFVIALLNHSLRTGQIILGGAFVAFSSYDHFHIGPLAIPMMLVDFALLFAFAADVLVRYSFYTKDERWAGGFLEWLLPNRKPAAAQTNPQ
jgi:hypothetical protein